jgi:hypothetical protein
MDERSSTMNADNAQYFLPRSTRASPDERAARLSDNLAMRERRPPQRLGSPVRSEGGRDDRA